MGGHSYSHHHHHHHGGGRISYSSGGGNCNCNCKAVLFVLFIFVIILYIIIAAATFPKPSNKEITLSLSETRIMGVKPSWFDQISGDSPNFKYNATTYDMHGSFPNDVQLLRFKKKPLATVTDSWSVNESQSIADYDHYYWSWYFYQGSTIQVSWSYNYPITMYLIRSTKGYNSYYDEDGYVSSYTVDKVSSSSSTRFYTVERDDIYFVIFENWDLPYTVRGNSVFNINSKLLNVSNPDDSCTLPCSMSVPYGSSETYILHTPTVSEYVASGVGEPNSEFTFRFRKSARVWFIVVILFIVPLAIMLAIFGIVMCIIYKKNSMSKVPSSVSSTPAPPIDMVPMATIAASPYPPQVVYATPYPTAGGPPTYMPPPTDVYPPPSSSIYPPPSSSPSVVYPHPPPPHSDPSVVYPPPSSSVVYPHSDPIGSAPPTGYPEPQSLYPPPSSSVVYPPSSSYSPNPLPYNNNNPPPVNPDYNPNYPS